MKVLVFGSTGFIGRNMVSALQSLGHDAVGCSRTAGLDLTNLDSLRMELSSIVPDAVINLAAHVGSVHYGMKHSAQILHDNMSMTLNLYKGVAEICPHARIVNPISNCSYPGASDVQREEEWWAGEAHFSALAYGSSRRMTYVAAKCYQQQYGICSKNFILPGVYGPGDHADTERVHALDGMIIRMISAKRQKQPTFEIWGSGNPVREWCYVDDIVQIMIRGLTIEKDLIYPVNIGQKRGYSIRESAEMITEALGYTGKLVFNTSYPDGDAVKILDDKRFRELFPDFVFCDMKQGIRNTVQYYESIL
jgi:GDP-L-fucose synthase